MRVTMSQIQRETPAEIESLFDQVERAVVLSPDSYAKSRIAKLQRIVDEQGAAVPPTTTEIQAELVRKAIELMSSNIQNPLTITQIAAECHTSPTMLKQTFKKVVGAPVYQWYRHHRLDRARILLRTTELPISQIAYGVGYANSSKFSKAFREEFGVSPSKWRTSAEHQEILS